MSNIETKKQLVLDIKEKLGRAASIVVIDPIGLTVEQDTQLRKELREANVEYKIYKNTMFKFAIEDSEYKELSDVLAGPSAFAISYDDATIAASIINKLQAKMKAIEFKAGIIEGIYYDHDSIIKIAKIPSRDELLSKLLGSLKSPISSFARVLKQIAEKDGEETVVEAETVEETAVEAPKEEVKEEIKAPKTENEAAAKTVEETVVEVETVEETVVEIKEETKEETKDAEQSEE